MRASPPLQAVRFNSLKHGDLFIARGRDTPYVAMKVIDPKDGGDDCVLLIGPNLPEKSVLWLISARHETVVALGADYNLRLPVNPENWVFDEPTDHVPCVLLVEGKHYFRANFSHDASYFRPCWIGIENGVLQYDRPIGSTAYALKWEIAFPEPLSGGGTLQLP